VVIVHSIFLELTWFDYFAIAVNTCILAFLLVQKIFTKHEKRNQKKTIDKEKKMTDIEKEIYDTISGSSRYCISQTLDYISEEYKFDYEMRIRLSDAILNYYFRFSSDLISVPGKDVADDKVIEKRIDCLFEYANIPPRDEDSFIAKGPSSFPVATKEGNGRYYYARKVSSSFLSYGEKIIKEFSQCINDSLGFSGNAYIETLDSIAKLWFISDHRFLCPRGIVKKELLDLSGDPTETEKVIEFLKFPKIKDTNFRLYEIDGVLYCSDFYAFAEKKLALLDYDEGLCKILHKKSNEPTYLEEEVAQRLKEAMPNAEIWQGVFLNGNETDVVVLNGDDLLLFECKADKFTPWMMEDDKRRSSAEKNLKRAAEQLQVRAQKCISSHNATLTDSDKTVIKTIYPPKKIRGFVVTQENLINLSYLTKETIRKLNFTATPFIFSYDDLAFGLERTSSESEALEFLRLCSEGYINEDHVSGLFEFESRFENISGDVKNVIIRNGIFTEKATNLFFSKEIANNTDTGSEVSSYFKTLIDSIPPNQKDLINDLLKIKNQFLACSNVGQLEHRRYLLGRYDLTLSTYSSPKRASISFSCAEDGSLRTYEVYDNYRHLIAYFDSKDQQGTDNWK